MAYCICCGNRSDLSKPQCQECLKHRNEVVRLCAKTAADSGFCEANADNAISDLILLLIKPTNVLPTGRVDTGPVFRRIGAA